MGLVHDPSTRRWVRFFIRLYAHIFLFHTLFHARFSSGCTNGGGQLRDSGAADGGEEATASLAARTVDGQWEATETLYHELPYVMLASCAPCTLYWDGSKKTRHSFLNLHLTVCGASSFLT